MFKYFTLLFIGIAAVLAFLYFRVGVPDIYANQNSIKVSAHIYDKPDLSIKKINLIAVYFVPKDRQELQITDWQERLDNSLSRLTAFHRLETSGNSVINYVIYPQPMIGLELGQIYDTENTNYGNPHALIAVGRELEARLLSPDGDLWSPEIAAPVYKNSYRSVIELEPRGQSASRWRFCLGFISPDPNIKPMAPPFWLMSFTIPWVYPKGTRCRARIRSPRISWERGA